MTSALRKKIATPDLEVATVGDLWRLSDEAGVSAGALLRALDKLKGADAESFRKVSQNGVGHVALSVEVAVES